MEIGKTIRNLRSEAGMSQEELAEKAFVSRQTISNWENDKSYPDVQSLALIAQLFGTSIDSLVKGDLPMIETKIAEQDVKTLKRNANFYGVLLVVSLAVIVVSFMLENWLALATGVLVYALALYYAFLVEADKKKCDVRTYREIKALCDGASVEEIKSIREAQGTGSFLAKRIAVAGCIGAAAGIAISAIARLFC